MIAVKRGQPIDDMAIERPHGRVQGFPLGLALLPTAVGQWRHDGEVTVLAMNGRITTITMVITTIAVMEVWDFLYRSIIRLSIATKGTRYRCISFASLFC